MMGNHELFALLFFLFFSKGVRFAETALVRVLEELSGSDEAKKKY
jgi:hypothetical protein